MGKIKTETKCLRECQQTFAGKLEGITSVKAVVATV